MFTPPGDKRPAMAVAMDWASQVTTIAVMMALPPYAGYWVDNWLGTDPWLLILGAVFGLVVGMMQLLRLVNRTSRKPGNLQDKQ